MPRERGRATQRPGGRVIPAARSGGAIEKGDVPDHGERHGERVGRDFVDVGVRHIGDPGAMPPGRRDIDVIDADAQGRDEA